MCCGRPREAAVGQASGQRLGRDCRGCQSLGTVQGVAIECCCGAANLAKELADQTGWNVSLAHPGFVARMKQNPDKTDFTDARILADLHRVGYLPKVWLAPREIRELRRIVRFRQRTGGRAAERQAPHSGLAPRRADSSARGVRPPLDSRPGWPGSVASTN